ncbi:hypothetical protein BMS77_10040 [Leuconostoc pseudomesenteroides]|jgi:KUP system potassium uptake protein|nr:hypothetical protein BMS77_10040 [Leuconostoc pseudomesenteroides]OQJ74345.1 hypothetical protein BMS83_09855 [Leuconostoc pseudomesenteroides]OQJ75677.1 hypothetical protein BMS82_09210 [Leuconostoc pseudomesenteroides]ORI35673.1 hypothetical protein BMR88_09340 [Leuconostoc pseudomesenteroides]ORI44143.1 hypothetical protein BMR94_09360 [Leuconostoc pseudomesenteroides]
MLGTNNIVHVTLNIGFKVEPQVNMYMKQIANNLVKQNIIKPQFPKYTLNKRGTVGEFKYIMANQNYEDLLNLPDIHTWDRFIISGRLWLQSHTVKPSSFYGLEVSDVLEETVPLFIKDSNKSKIKLIQNEVKNVIKPE